MTGAGAGLIDGVLWRIVVFPTIVTLRAVSTVPPGDHDIDSAVHRLKLEIDDLTEQQSRALQSAIYLGMSPEEARRYDGRRKHIMNLIRELRLLQGSQ